MNIVDTRFEITIEPFPDHWSIAKIDAFAKHHEQCDVDCSEFLRSYGFSVRLRVQPHNVCFIQSIDQIRIQ